MTPTAVIFDFHRTLVVAGSLHRWLDQAAAATGDPVDAAVALPILRTVWARAALRYPDARWDLDPVMHRRAFTEVLTEDSPCTPGMADALYALMPQQWVAVDGALDLLTRLKARGARVGLLSNTALDLRPRLAELGLLPLLDDVTLSFEEGMVKPDPALFDLSATRLGVSPAECLYVGDTPSTDGGATGAGMTCVLVPVLNDRPGLGIAASLLDPATGPQ